MTATYDEFGLFHQNAEEWGLPFDGPPTVRRDAVEFEPGRTVSSLVWGDAPPEVVALHGGGQNAHTWDTVALALGLPLVAIDLPGHGHSDATDTLFSPRDYAVAVEVAVRALAPDARLVMGMSMGGLTAIALAARAPDLVRALVLVDVVPTIDPARVAPIGEFLNGPERFTSFDELLARTMKFNPTRTESSLRRGILHNAVEREDGTWVWRHQRQWTPRDERPAAGGLAIPDYSSLWDDLAAVEAPTLLLYGTTEQSIITDEILAELEQRRPGTAAVGVADAGHSIQGDQPVVLAQVVTDFLTGLGSAGLA
ncbi:MAG TPA: alpha/beta hydrolase [Acidimicrobiia bacterium]|nr:alpha/beta hydrolase [Acidimicrobiia bacterium]